MPLRRYTLIEDCWRSVVTLSAAAANCGLGLREAKTLGLLSREIDSGFLRDDSRLVAHVQQAADGFSSVGAVIEGALVDVHTDEFVREWGVEVASELHGVGERFFAMVERVLDALA